jgi:hypothetical protein
VDVCGFYGKAVNVYDHDHVNDHEVRMDLGELRRERER